MKQNICKNVYCNILCRCFVRNVSVYKRSKRFAVIFEYFFKSFFVTLNDSDTAVLALSDLISKALNKALAL